MDDEPREEAIANDILREYRELDATLQSLGRLTAKQRSADAGDGITRDLIDEHLRRVRNHMERLFAYEESGGFYEDLLRLLPAESPRIRALKEEHPGLLARVSALIARMGERDGADLELLRSEIRSFSCALDDHEQRERSLLRRPYYSDEGTVD